MNTVNFPVKHDDGSLTLIPDVKSRKTMRIGFSFDDNDTPGADVQHMLNWPVTYNPFMPPANCELAIFE